ncbi:uncharacterized protein LOC116568733 [Mustela erminea]|uniref:uncharacterized protein LOC116568733 n=1 Tax=Mustela erminea TaxID=36723 RepID=UPI001386A91C|nr:uncharacterized protein LOC116568733 [Mustela erminea]
MGQARGLEQGSGPLPELGQNGSQGFKEPSPTPTASKRSIGTEGPLPARRCAGNLETWDPVPGLESLQSGDSRAVGKKMIYQRQTCSGVVGGSPKATGLTTQGGELLQPWVAAGPPRQPRDVTVARGKCSAQTRASPPGLSRTDKASFRDSSLPRKASRPLKCEQRPLPPAHLAVSSHHRGSEARSVTPTALSGARGQEQCGSTPEPRPPPAGPTLLPPSAVPWEDEGGAEPTSPVVVSCAIRRAIKNNKHTDTCSGPAAAVGHAEVTAWERKQSPGLVERNNSISEEQEPHLGLQSPSQ